MPKQSLCIFKEVIFKRNLTIIILIRTRSGKLTVCFSVIGTQTKAVPRSMQAAQRGTTLNKPAQKLKKNIKPSLKNELKFKIAYNVSMRQTIL